MHLLNRLSLTENFHRGPGKRSRAVLIKKPILCKLPRQSAKNSYKAFGEGGAALALVKPVNLANSNPDTSKLPLSPHFFPPGGPSLFCSWWGHPWACPLQLYPTRMAQQTLTTESECKLRTFFSPPVKGKATGRRWSFPTSHQGRGSILSQILKKKKKRNYFPKEYLTWWRQSLWRNHLRGGDSGI